MIDTRFQPVDAPERETAKEPPKIWFNWWISNQFNWCDECLGSFEAMKPYTCCGAYPSRDLAETAAERDEARQIATEGRIVASYLGAFPEGEQPKRQN